MHGRERAQNAPSASVQRVLGPLSSATPFCPHLLLFSSVTASRPYLCPSHPAKPLFHPPVLFCRACPHSSTCNPQSLATLPSRPPQRWVCTALRPRSARQQLTEPTAEKRPSTEGLVDNVDPRASTELEELPKYETPEEPAATPLKEKLITCFWIALNTFSTLGLIFLSKRYGTCNLLAVSAVLTSTQGLQR